MLHISRPAVSGGAAVETARGPWTIEGWALARGGVASVEVRVDGRHFGDAYYGIPREDIAAGFPDWEGAAFSGFGLAIGARALPRGRRHISVELRSKTGLRTEEAFFVEVEPAAQDGPGVVRRKMSLAELQIAQGMLSGLAWHPEFGVLLAIGEVDEEIPSARLTLASLREQAYRAWRVIVVRRGRVAPRDAAARLLEGFDDIAERIDIRLDAKAADDLAGLVRSAARDAAVGLIGVLLAGDVLGCDALLEMAVASGLHPEAEFFYSDERRTSPVTARSEAFFKPQWSPDFLGATNYIGRFWCALPGLFDRARLTLGEWFQFGDYDLVLRCTEVTAGIHHVAKLLCERGRPQLDHPDQERAALARRLRRRGIGGEVRTGAVAGHYRVLRANGESGLVSVIIPTCAAQGLIKTCIETLRSVTAYRNFEIICVDNIPASQPRWKEWVQQNADIVVPANEAFNWSRFNNLAAAKANGRYLLFLNDDTEIIEPGWLDALLEHAARPEVGVVAGRLLYPDGTVQHAGIFWTPRGGRHAFRHAAGSDPGYFGMALSERNVLAATGACLLVRRSEFQALGGFDERHTIVNNDVDFCLRCWERGKSVVYTPHATLVHREGMSRRALGDDFDEAQFARRWAGTLRAGDPFHHPLLSRGRDDYAYDAEPSELVYSGRPLFEKADIKRILAVKLDHIGDFITAIPALRQLRAEFPQAELRLLAAPASAALGGLVPGLTGILQFEFFFARSGLGQRNLSLDDLQALQRRLAPYRFDLAIDLRKAPETRHVLQFTGARWLAGFDHNQQFPWLDVVAEWETDQAALRKRAHIGEDLQRLVAAIAIAAAPVAALSPVSKLPSLPANIALSERVRAEPASHSRLVCVHPGVGSPIRQWPAAYFAELIDLLTANHDVEVVLIGSPEEAGIAEEVLQKVERPNAVRSLAGTLPLPELPRLLAGTALFVGNNSGPQHLAAGLGIPTIGIHSGTVDAREWGPVGANAVAIRRDVVCSPCYLSDPAGCLRGLACLTELRPFEVYELCKRLLAIEVNRSQASS